MQLSVSLCLVCYCLSNSGCPIKTIALTGDRMDAPGQYYVMTRDLKLNYTAG